MTTSIYEVMVTHALKVRPLIMEEFNARTIAYFADNASEDRGVVDHRHDDPLFFVTIMQGITEREYMNPFLDAVEVIWKKFEDHGILFRLHDIDNVLHDFGRVKFMWSLNNHLYGFEFSFNTTGEALSFLGYQILTAKPDCANGDPAATLETTPNPIHEDDAFPGWFISGLGLNS